MVLVSSSPVKRSEVVNSILARNESHRRSSHYQGLTAQPRISGVSCCVSRSDKHGATRSAIFTGNEAVSSAEESPLPLVSVTHKDSTKPIQQWLGDTPKITTYKQVAKMWVLVSLNSGVRQHPQGFNPRKSVINGHQLD